MTMNAKNELQELFQRMGWKTPAAGLYSHERVEPSGRWRSTIDFRLEDDRHLSGVGEADTKSQADVAAAAAALEKLEPEPDDLDVRRDAQAGDALIKLAAYLVLGDPAAASTWLQSYEADAHLAKVCERWARAGDPEVLRLGAGRGWKHRASIVEALIWRRYRGRVLGPEGEAALREIVDLLEAR